ncbi:MAG: beta-lactamase family protein [Burkholderiaceae bacterium]|nr:beta-lactamase family protein [Burkholderiaceae bacterium]
MNGFVRPDFRGVAQTFERQLPRSQPGGAALCIYHRGERVVDIWGGSRDRAGMPWTADTLSLSFSTTKGVVSTLLHILASRGMLDYDTPVSHYWPAFAQNGKAAITVRQLLCHEAGLYGIRSLVKDAAEMRDWPHMLQLLEQSAPVHRPGERNGYHALTFGWLVGGLVEKISDKALAQVLREELTEPLQLEGCFIGVPDAEMPRCADLITPEKKPRDPQASPRQKKGPSLQQRVIDRALRLSGFDPDSTREAMVPHGMGRFDWNTAEARKACIPGAGGMFTARSLAKIYAALGHDGAFEGARILPPGTVARLAKVQNTSRGAVVPLPMRWRMGYHRVFTTGPRTPHAFGHFGYGGSGAWCDPSRQLGVGYVVNFGTGTPFGDMRLCQLNTAAIRAVDSLPRLLWQWVSKRGRGGA